jgi:PadR family transcriptional regulator
MITAPTLSDMEWTVMLAIGRIGDDAYGVFITDEIEATTGKEVLLGTVYDSLAHLQQKGLVTSLPGDATPERGGRAKCYFRLTSRGRRFVQEIRQSF